MSTLSLLSFLFLTFSILSLWVKRDPRVWGSLLGLSLLFGLIAGNILWLGLIFLGGLILLWVLYAKKPNIVLFIALILVTICYKFHLIPGYHPVFVTPKFQIRLELAILGLLPLALLVPLSKTVQDWKKVLKGLIIGCAGIGILAILATITGATHWEFKLPTSMVARGWSNLILTSIPEEGFYRGFLQRGLSHYFKETKMGKTVALILTSLIFTLTHVYWSPSAAILGFVFLASLLYGGVYLLSGKIESAILCHFLLNLIHMIFFEYHAM
jgi:uncharacterized protein